jgi:P27 family predicted phage terminase small subunit
MLAPDLLATDRLRTEDLPTFEQFCTAYYFALYAGALLVREGIIVEDVAHGKESRKHPAWQMWRDAVKTMRQLACEFGVTPSSRVRLSLPSGPDPENPWKTF